MDHIDDDLISEAINETSRKKHAWIKWISVAACFLVVFVSISAIAPMLFDQKPPILDPEPNNDPIYPDPNSGEEGVLVKYYDYKINDGEFADYIGGEVISEGMIGKKIDTITVTGGWKNAVGEWLSTERLTADVYEIDGVPKEIKVALKFNDKGEALTTTHYYQIGIALPNYSKENPVRYLEQTPMGQANGWQDFGVSGEMRTIPVPIGSTYTYQMYAYYIRNDLRHLYSNEALPDSIYDLPEWLAYTETTKRIAFWYSMSGRLPEDITLTSTREIVSENREMSFIAAEYKVKVKLHGSTEREENWVIYFMEEDGVYSSFAVIANENFDFVKTYTESIVKSYQEKE